jgi:hypothetical protein
MINVVNQRLISTNLMKNLRKQLIMMIEPVNYREELSHISKVLTMEVKEESTRSLLPVLYNQYTAFLRNLKDFKVDLTTILPTPEQVEKVNPSPQADEKIYTGIIDDLNTLIGKAQADAENVFDPKFTKSLTTNKAIKKSILDYHTSRVFRYFKKLEQHIQALIVLDDYPAVVFGEYHMIIKNFKEAKTENDRQEYLDELILVARSVIPLQVRKQTTVNIEQSISSPTRMS